MVMVSRLFIILWYGVRSVNILRLRYIFVENVFFKTSFYQTSFPNRELTKMSPNTYAHIMLDY